MNLDHGFGEPEDWCEEDDEDIVATQAFYRVILELVKQGIQVDSFEFFDHKEVISSILGSMQVDVNQVPVEAFRFFEQIHFQYI